MGEVINLRQARKKKKTADKDKRAEENRVRYGLTKAEKQKLKQDDAKKASQLDGHKLDQDEKDE